MWIPNPGCGLTHQKTEMRNYKGDPCLEHPNNNQREIYRKIDVSHFKVNIKRTEVSVLKH